MVAARNFRKLNHLLPLFCEYVMFHFIVSGHLICLYLCIFCLRFIFSPSIMAKRTGRYVPFLEHHGLRPEQFCPRPFPTDAPSEAPPSAPRTAAEEASHQEIRLGFGQVIFQTFIWNVI